MDYFNSLFMSAWKDTNNYKAWVCNYGDTISEISPCHPFSGQLSVADMKLKLSQYVFKIQEQTPRYFDSHKSNLTLIMLI